MNSDPSKGLSVVFDACFPRSLRHSRSTLRIVSSCYWRYAAVAPCLKSIFLSSRSADFLMPRTYLSIHVECLPLHICATLTEVKIPRKRYFWHRFLAATKQRKRLEAYTCHIKILRKNWNCRKAPALLML